MHFLSFSSGSHMTSTLSTRDVMKLSWDSSSDEQKLVLLISAYEACARDKALEMRKDFVLPRYTSYADLLRTPISAKDAERLARIRRIFRKLVSILDKEGILYRDYLKGVFWKWRTPRRHKSVYLSGVKVPAAFPLPQHLVGREAMNSYCTWLTFTSVPPPDTPAEEIEGARQFLDVAKANRGLRTDRAALKNAYLALALGPAFLRASPAFLKLFQSGYYRRDYGQVAHDQFVRILSG
jgi:hypothetical protein